MKQDPNYIQEQEKYENPVPSREFILETLRKKSPMTRPALLNHFKIFDEERTEGLRRRLRAMENEGQIIFVKKQGYLIAKKSNKDLIEGEVIAHKDGFGFLKTNDGNDDYFIHFAQMNKVMHGDIVLARKSPKPFRGKTEVSIIKIVKPNTKPIVGRYFVEKNKGFVIADDSRIKGEILIDKKHNKGVRMGQMVVCSLFERSENSYNLQGKIIEVLGDEMSSSMAVKMAVANYQIPEVFPKKVVKQAKSFGSEVLDCDKEERLDLRSLPLITIDGETARDFDDAIYCEKQGKNYRLIVAIADVSHYVTPKTALDIEAAERGNSVYFPTMVIPMLPEELSNGLCSLNPNVDRLCLACDMVIDDKGKVKNYQFRSAIMHSKARLTYNKVAKILEGDSELCDRYQEIVGDLKTFEKLYDVLEQRRVERGAIAFETNEPHFVFNAQGTIESIETIVRNKAHKMIEEAMILANICAAQFVQKYHKAAPFRIHESPSDEKLMLFKSYLNSQGLSLSGGNKPTPKDFSDLLTQIEDRPNASSIQMMLLRSLSQAVYSTENKGHFGLALTEYAHFTSPIRRYPDLLLHRTIKSILKQQKEQSKKALTGHFNYDEITLERLCEQSSKTERRADEATREVADWLKCEFMQDKVGEVFEGTIASVASFGIFVKLDEFMIDGLVHITNLTDDYYDFDKDRQRLVGSNGKIMRLGDRLKVKVLAVNMQDKQIDFVIEGMKKAVKGKSNFKKKESGKKSLKKSESKNFKDKPKKMKSASGKKVFKEKSKKFKKR